MHFSGEEKYKQFTARLVPTNYEIVGVRVPVLRTMAKKAIWANDWQKVIKETPMVHEDVLLQSFIIAAAPITVEQRQRLLEDFFPYMDNWQVVDGLCSSLKEAKKEQQSYWEWLCSLRASEQPFVIRFVLVMYLTYYLNESYIDDVLQYIEQLENDHYYVKMAIAWCISMAFVKDEQRIVTYLIASKLDKWTYNKAIQKIIESTRVSVDKKAQIKLLRK